MVPGNNKLLSLKLNPDRMEENSTFQIDNNKLPCQNSRQHKTIQIIQSTCVKGNQFSLKFPCLTDDSPVMPVEAEAVHAQY